MADTKPYGDVTYADPGYQKDKQKRYPLDSEGHVRAAWSYINMPRNASQYSSDQLASIKGAIRSAAKKFGVTIAGDEKNSQDLDGEVRMEAPTENLIRMAQRSAPPGIKDGRTLFGMAVVYDSPAEVRSWEGNFMERVMPGAARKTISEQRESIRCLFNHGMDPSIGEKPLGRPEVIEERSNGVYVEVPVAETSYGDDILALVDAKAIDGWSYRFSVPKGKESWQRPSQRGQLAERQVFEMRMPEFGPVTFPVYEATSIGVRSHAEYAVFYQMSPLQQEAFRSVIVAGVPLGTSLEEAVEMAIDTSAEEAASDNMGEPDGSDDFDPTVGDEDRRSADHSTVSYDQRQQYLRRVRAEQVAAALTLE